MTLSVINSKIKQAEKSAGRAAGSTNLIAVSKVQPNERVLNVLEHGHKVFGENKVQEAHGKWPMFREIFSNVKVHLIGPLQSNKVKQSVALSSANNSTWDVDLGYTAGGFALTYGVDETDAWTATATSALGGGATFAAGVSSENEMYAGVSFAF